MAIGGDEKLSDACKYPSRIAYRTKTQAVARQERARLNRVGRSFFGHKSLSWGMSPEHSSALAPVLVLVCSHARDYMGYMYTATICLLLNPNLSLRSADGTVLPSMRLWLNRENVEGYEK
jgi:hypothetical protein